ncbi:MAG TPA: hypothetical protein VGJ13_08085, partial [Pseudonocardiaceae bacterium]
MSGDSNRYHLPGFWSQGSRHQPSVALWESTRRGQLVGSFASHVYGYAPDGGGLGDISVHTRRGDALDGSAARIEADLTLAGPKGTRTASLLAYVPAAASALRPVPA